MHTGASFHVLYCMLLKWRKFISNKTAFLFYFVDLYVRLLSSLIEIIVIMISKHSCFQITCILLFSDKVFFFFFEYNITFFKVKITYSMATPTLFD